MAEAISLSSAVVSLVSTAYKSCQTLHNTIDGFRGAHEQILALSSDLENFYLVLGTLQVVLQDEASSAASVERLMSEGLSKALEDSMEIFKKITVMVNKYQAPDPTSLPRKWHKAKWVFEEKKTADLMKELMQCKMTLSIAISMANEYNLRAVRASSSKMQSEMSMMNATAARFERELTEHHQQLLSRLPAILQLQQEKALDLALMAPSRHLEDDRMIVRTDIQLTMRRLVDSAAASFSSIVTPPTPTVQVSSFEVSSQASTYCTAPVGRNVAPDRTSIGNWTQVFVRNAGPAKTLVVQIDPDSTFDQLKGQVRERIKLPEAQFALVHSGRLMTPHDNVKTLKEYGVKNYDTFTCVSFLPRPNLPPKARERWPVIDISVHSLGHQDQHYWQLSLESDIWIPKRNHCRYKCKGSVVKFDAKKMADPHDVELVFKGTVLYGCISDDLNEKSSDSPRFWALFSPDAVKKPARTVSAKSFPTRSATTEGPPLKDTSEMASGPRRTGLDTLYGSSTDGRLALWRKPDDDKPRKTNNLETIKER